MNKIFENSLFRRGIHGALTDYVHGDILKPIVNGVTTLLGIIAFAGLILLNVNDVGFGAAVKKTYTELLHDVKQ